MRIFFFLLIISMTFISCEKNTKIDLSDNDLMVTEILNPNPTSSEFTVKIVYINGMIGCITTKANSRFFIDSTKFFYSGLILDSALLYSNYYIRDTLLLKFHWNDTLVTSIDEYSVSLKKIFSVYKFNYTNKRLINITSNYLKDTISYDNKGRISEHQVYKRYSLSQDFSLYQNYEMKKYYDFYNPYYLISKRLRFPYFTLMDKPYVLRLTDLVEYCYFSSKFEYKLDEKNRVIGISDIEPPVFTTTIKYK
jgi:hypothetical protein